MTVPSLKKLVLPATVLAGTMFSSLTVPLAVFGLQPVDIQVDQEVIFSGKLKDLAAPYVGVAGILSLGAGVAGVAIAGWQQSSRKSGQLEAKLTSLQQELNGKEQQLEAAMLSESRLEASGLDFFLQDETLTNVAASVKAEIKPVVVNPKASIVEHRVSSAQVANVTTDAESGQAAVQSVVSTLAAAQAFLSFTRSNSAVNLVDNDLASIEAPSSTNITLQELQNQLKQIMSQVETLRGSLEAGPQSVLNQPEYTVNTLDHLHHRSAVKPQWVAQPLAS